MAEQKPGLKTTEFWMAFVVVAAGTVAAVYSDREWAQIAGGISGALAAAGYSYARSVVKAAEVKK